MFVSYEMKADDVDVAAEDLLFWLRQSSSEDVENDNTTRTSSRQVIGASLEFLNSTTCKNHPLAPQIRSRCLELAGGAYTVLSHEVQQASGILPNRVPEHGTLQAETIPARSDLVGGPRGLRAPGVSWRSQRYRIHGCVESDRAAQSGAVPARRQRHAGRDK